jgi:hypothetical protein
LPSSTEIGLASRSSKMRDEAPRPFMMVPKKLVRPMREDPMLRKGEKVSGGLARKTKTWLTRRCTP